MSTATYTVKGMTCDHCVSSVREEVGEIPGVTSVEVSLESGVLTVESDSPIERTDIVTAVKTAGYEVADQ